MKKLLVIAGLVAAAHGVAHAATAEVMTCFTPAERCEPLVVSAINAATQEILVQSYTFTSRGIAAALEAAHHRGVRVEVIFDKSEDPNLPTAPLARELVQAGIPVLVDARVAIAHNKVMVVDAARVLTGSYNWTVAAEKQNAENLVVLDSPEIARRYRENWASRYTLSKPVQQ